MPRLTPLLAVLVLVLLVAVPPARAGERAEEVQVLGPAQDDQPGLRLFARFSSPVDLCLTVTGDFDPGEPGNDCGRSGPDVAGDPFVRDVQAGVFGGPRKPGDPERAAAMGGAVSSDVAAVEYDLPGRRRVRAETVPAPPQLAGTPGAELRWFVVAVPAVPYTRRLLDASGTVLAEEDGPFGGERPPLRGPTRLLAGGRGAATWSLRAAVSRMLVPVRGDAGRRERLVCLSLAERRGEGSSGETGGPCTTPGEPIEQIGVHLGCGRTGHAVVYGFLPPGAAAPTAVLGDGRRVRARMRRLAPAGGGELLAWAIAAPSDMAIRSVTVGGRTERAAIQPATLAPCGLFGFGYEDERGGPLLGGDATVAPPDGPALSVRDRGDELCLAAARPTGEQDCELPAPGIGEILESHDEAATQIGLAVDARVRTVRVRLTDGRTVLLATVPAAPAYAGRYASHVAFASYSAPPGVRIAEVAPLDLRGRPSRVSMPIARQRLDRPTRTLRRGRGPGGPFRVTVTPWEPAGAYDQTGVCVHLATGSATDTPTRDCPQLNAAQVGLLTGEVDCRARVAMLATAVTRATRSVTVHLSDGSVRRAPIHRVAGERIAIAVPPARLGVRRIVLRGRSGRALTSFAAPVAAATRQCGYDVFVVTGSDSLG